MKRRLAATAALIGLAIGIGSAAAADMAEPLSFDWSGPYVGAQAGLASGDASYENIANAAVYDGAIDGAFLGARGGFRRQLDMLVLGVSAEINGAGISGSGDDGLDGAHFDVNWFGSLDVQAGLAFDRLLVYAIGGVAFAGIQHDYDSGSPGGNDNSYGEKTHTGFTIGGGLAFAVTDSIAIRLEGRQYEFDRKEFGQVLDIIPHTVEADFQTVTLGVEFTF